MLEATILATLGRPLKWSIAAHQLILTPADATVPSLQWRDTPDGNINPVTSLATDTSTATTLHSPALDHP